MGEHVRDDFLFLQSIKGILKQGGRLYLTVPAYSFLWSAEDIVAGHCRRYSLTRICELVERAGFEIELASYVFRLLPIPIALFRALPYRLRFARSKKKVQQVVRDHVIRSRTLGRILDVVCKTEIKKLAI